MEWIYSSRFLHIWIKLCLSFVDQTSIGAGRYMLSAGWCSTYRAKNIGHCRRLSHTERIYSIVLSWHGQTICIGEYTLTLSSNYYLDKRRVIYPPLSLQAFFWLLQFPQVVKALTLSNTHWGFFASVVICW